MKSVKAVVLLIVALILAPGLVRAHHPRPDSPPVVAAGVCPPVQNTQFFTIAYGTVTINDQDAPAGAIAEARTPRGEMAGCFAVSTLGHYGAMYVYGEDTSVTPPVPGMREGEVVAFYVNGVAATSVPTLTWTNDWALHLITVHADAAMHRQYLPLVVRGYVPE